MSDTEPGTFWSIPAPWMSGHAETTPAVGWNPAMAWRFPSPPPPDVTDEQLLAGIKKAQYLGRHRWASVYAVSLDRQTWTELLPPEGPRIGGHRA